MATYKRYHKEDGFSYALGITVTFELLKCRPEYARKVYVSSAMKKGDTLDRLLMLCGSLDVEVIYTDKIFRVLSQKENCYVIGEFEKFSLKPDMDKSHIVLVNPSNSGNMGTIMRSALGFGLNRLIIIRPAADAFDPKVVRASMGAVFSTEFAYYDSFGEYMEEACGRELYPFMLNAKKALYDVKADGVFSLIFGNEATGLPDSFRDVGTSVIIPHSDKIDSLNLPIAASIAMYHMTVGAFMANA